MIERETDCCLYTVHGKCHQWVVTMGHPTDTNKQVVASKSSTNLLPGKKIYAKQNSLQVLPTSSPALLEQPKSVILDKLNKFDKDKFDVVIQQGQASASTTPKVIHWDTTTGKQKILWCGCYDPE